MILIKCDIVVFCKDRNSSSSNHKYTRKNDNTTQKITFQQLYKWYRFLRQKQSVSIKLYSLLLQRKAQIVFSLIYAIISGENRKVVRYNNVHYTKMSGLQ